MKKGTHSDAEHVRGVYERDVGSGVWWIRYTDEHGKLRRRKVAPKVLARRLYKDIKRKVTTAKITTEFAGPEKPPAPIPRTIAEMIDDVLARTKGQLRSWRNYAQSAKLWKLEFPEKALDEVLPGDIERWRAAQYAVKVPPKPATVNRHLAFLKRVFKLAMQDGYCTKTPFHTVTLQKENNRRLRFLSEEEEARLCAAIPDERDRLAVQVAIYTGMRQGEQFSMKWGEVDFQNRVITIPRSKHGDSRIVRLNDCAMRYFNRLLQLNAASPYVFPSETNSTPIVAGNFYNRTFKPALKRAGIENFHWHDLRHTFGSRLGMLHVSAVEIAALMGHKTTAMAERYVHLAQGHLHDVVSQLDEVADRIHGSAPAPATDPKTDTNKATMH